jgi:hypothetical protein
VTVCFAQFEDMIRWYDRELISRNNAAIPTYAILGLSLEFLKPSDAIWTFRDDWETA